MSTSSSVLLLIIYLLVQAGRKDRARILFVYLVIILCQKVHASGPVLACHSASESAKSGLCDSAASCANIIVNGSIVVYTHTHHYCEKKYK